MWATFERFFAGMFETVLLFHLLFIMTDYLCRSQAGDESYRLAL
jgi:hypothetical protein